MTASLGGWIGALVVGLLLYLLAPFAPAPLDRILRVVGLVVLVLAAVLFLLWAINLFTGASVLALALT